MTNRLTGKFRPLLDPFQRYCSRQRVRRFLHNNDEKFLEHLRRRAEILGLDQFESAFSFMFFAPTSAGCRVDQYVCIEKDVNVHASLGESRTLYQVLHAIAYSAPTGVRVPHVPDSRDGRFRSGGRAPRHCAGVSIHGVAPHRGQNFLFDGQRDVLHIHSTCVTVPTLRLSVE
jgi:hypothetical protein